jgi:hypothetical protein
MSLVVWFSTSSTILNTSAKVGILALFLIFRHSFQYFSMDYDIYCVIYDFYLLSCHSYFVKCFLLKLCWFYNLLFSVAFGMITLSSIILLLWWFTLLDLKKQVYWTFSYHLIFVSVSIISIFTELCDLSPLHNFKTILSLLKDGWYTLHTSMETEDWQPLKLF